MSFLWISSFISFFHTLSFTLCSCSAQAWVHEGQVQLSTAGTPELELPRALTLACLAQAMPDIFSRKHEKQKYQNTISNIIKAYSSDLHIILVQYLKFQPPVSKDSAFEEQHQWVFPVFFHEANKEHHMELCTPNFTRHYQREGISITLSSKDWVMDFVTNFKLSAEARATNLS